MKIIPAVDIKNGKCVRLLQGRMEDETVFSDDPSAMAGRWNEAGAETIHVVDLDGAVSKQPKNLEALTAILKNTDARIQVGGGVRDESTADLLFDLGVSRVIIGTEAIRNPGLVEMLCKKHPGRIIVGIDAREGKVAIEGWTETTGTPAVELAKRFEDCGVYAIIFTDINRDGMQTGPALEETSRLARSISIPVIASGGVSDIEDVKKLIPLKPLGVVGIIIGRALYSGNIELRHAIRIASQEARE
jgi:phosphoribosylformimino-5-aminoimidazole carboxamide ribotide isomerase